jgi:glutathione-specific gamma-glutamylcyclotransferase
VSGVTSPPELKPDLASLAGVALTREALNDDALRARLQAYLPAGTRLFTDEEHRAGIDAMLSERDAAEDVWVFAYGSLIWNPVVDHVERRAGTINGFHRRFCLWAPLGRGTPKQPSLTLGLDRGGRCRGVAFRIEAARAREELLLLWRREMLTGAYVPRWIDVATATQPVRAVTFVINRGHRGYAGRLPEADVVTCLAMARGFLGTSAEYLDHTIAALAEFGIDDPGLRRLQRRVKAFVPAPVTDAIKTID